MNKFLRRAFFPVLVALFLGAGLANTHAEEPTETAAAVGWFCHDEATIKKFIETPGQAAVEFMKVAAKSRICGVMQPPRLMVPLRYLGAVVNPDTGNSVDIWEVDFHPGNRKALAWKKQRGLPMFTSSTGKEFRETMLEAIKVREEAAKGSSI